MNEHRYFWNNIERYTGQKSLLRKCCIYLDYRMEYRRNLATYYDYFQYRFFEKSREERAKYITLGRLLEFAKKSNDAQQSKRLFNKAEFYARFINYICRDFMDLRDVGYEQFHSFAAKAGKIMIKPVEGAGGKDIHMEECSGEEVIRNVFAVYGGKPYVAEEVIKQHETLAALNPKGVNPIRINTFIDENGKAGLLVKEASTVRIGISDSPAVNLRNGAMEFLVDNKTGRICTEGLDEDGNRYSVHPVSGIELIGYQIPCWQELIDTAKKAAMEIPDLRFMGWDLTIDLNGNPVIIEGNIISDLSTEQILLNKGLQPVLDKLMEKYR